MVRGCFALLLVTSAEIRQSLFLRIFKSTNWNIFVIDTPRGSIPVKNKWVLKVAPLLSTHHSVKSVFLQSTPSVIDRSNNHGAQCPGWMVDIQTFLVSLRDSIFKHWHSSSIPGLWGNSHCMCDCIKCRTRWKWTLSCNLFFTEIKC
jgi:hypothetical protein